jgi:alcohol dehydrogenase class IV
MGFTDLPELLPSSGVGFVTDAHLAGLPVVRSALRSRPSWVVIVTPLGEPTTQTVDSVAHRLAEVDVGSVVGFGGGSVIDTVKLASLLAATGTSAEEHLGVLTDVDAKFDVLAVPTTAGSGAEVTRTCVVSRERRKSWAWGDRLRPRTVLVDPELTCSLPPSGTITTGLDALVHALEAATAPDAVPAAVASGTAAFDVVLETLPSVVSDGTDRSARAEMLDAALCAGFAIDLAGTGIGHAIGHTLGSMISIPHGLAVAFGMWSCLDWGLETSSQGYQRVDHGDSLRERIRAMFEAIGFERELRRWVGGPLDAAEFEAELRREEHRPMCRNNARPVTDGDVGEVTAMVVRAWNGMVE